MSYSTYATDTFKEIYASLDKSEQNWIDKTKKKLAENPTGKILQFSWFREKKFLNKRLFFLIDEELKKILFVSFASKRKQQDVIDFVVNNRQELLSYLKNIKD
ncbi:MAG: hypothetical protein AABW58_04590 [Nanoarchaeota archaeon]